MTHPGRLTLAVASWMQTGVHQQGTRLQHAKRRWGGTGSSIRHRKPGTHYCGLSRQHVTKPDTLLSATQLRWPGAAQWHVHVVKSAAAHLRIARAATAAWHDAHEWLAVSRLDEWSQLLLSWLSWLQPLAAWASG